MTSSNRYIKYFIYFLAFILPFEYRYIKPFLKLTNYLANISNSTYFYQEIYAYISDGLILLVLFFILLINKTKFKKILTRPNIYLLLFMCCCIASIINSNSGNYLLQFCCYFTYLTGIILFFLLANFISYDDFPKLIRNIFFIILISSTIESLISIYQYTIQDSVGLKIIGEINLREGSNFFMNNKLIFRASGTLPHSNILGGYIGFTIFASYYLYFTAKKKPLKYASIIILVLQLTTLIISFSRNALISLLISSIFYFIILKKKNYNIKLKQLFFIFNAILILLLFIFSPVIYNRGGLINQTKASKEADKYRIKQSKLAVKSILNNKLLGIGFNNYDTKFKKELKTKFNNNIVNFYIHNIYLAIAVEAGLLALFFFLLFLAYIFFKPIYSTKLTLEICTLLSMLLFLMIIGCFDYYIIRIQVGKLMFFLTAGLITSYIQHKKYINFSPVIIN